MKQHWYLVKASDVRARLLADRHYSRQTIGARDFTPPGNKIVLIIPSVTFGEAVAVWASQRPAPSSGLGRQDGFEYWHNVIFRNETTLKSSQLISEAIAITKHFWGEQLPQDGFHTFVDPQKVRGVKVRGVLTYGFCFLKAGFNLHDERTKTRNLLRLIFSRQQLLNVKAHPPKYEQQGYLFL